MESLSGEGGCQRQHEGHVRVVPRPAGNAKEGIRPGFWRRREVGHRSVIAADTGSKPAKIFLIARAFVIVVARLIFLCYSS
jgi:hypothetical protein